jgi:hypothetical protein
MLEAALLPRNLLNEGNQIPVHNLYCICEIFLWFHFITVPVPLRQKVTVPTVPVPVPQHCHCGAVENKQRDMYISKKRATGSYSVFTAVMKLVQIN